ncbi:MauE/DoxX family redox-associated membrane protein [Streptomyces sp. NPDC006368]|uniref:MauE/DoxX family redox-associated membrane protein n=1 Tax=Streptomyces sp. NPDC006368 TaxID=3156760 RepID=UPI0033A067C4
MEFVSALSQASLVLVFAAAFLGKIRNAASFLAFQDAVAALGRVPAARAGVPAAAVVFAEAATVLLLAVPWPHGDRLPAVIGLLTAIGLLASFTYAIARALRAGTRVACRCFGTSAGPVGPPQLVRNAVLLVVAVAALPGVAESGHLSWQARFAAWLCGATAALVLVVGDELAALLRSVPTAPTRTRT